MSKPEPKIIEYSREVGRDMTGHGWRKKLIYTIIRKQRNGKYSAAEVAFTTERKIHCGTCGTNEYLWLIPQRVGVFMACTKCNTSDGPITESIGEIVRQYAIKPIDAIEIMEKRGQVVPRDLRVLAESSRSKIRRADIPTDKY